MGAAWARQVMCESAFRDRRFGMCAVPGTNDRYKCLPGITYLSNDIWKTNSPHKILKLPLAKQTRHIKLHLKPTNEIGLLYTLLF